jgi:hypothetical protein
VNPRRFCRLSSIHLANQLGQLPKTGQLCRLAFIRPALAETTNSRSRTALKRHPGKAHSPIPNLQSAQKASLSCGWAFWVPAGTQREDRYPHQFSDEALHEAPHEMEARGLKVPYETSSERLLCSGTCVVNGRVISFSFVARGCSTGAAKLQDAHCDHGPERGGTGIPNQRNRRNLKGQCEVHIPDFTFEKPQCNARFYG